MRRRTRQQQRNWRFAEIIISLEHSLFNVKWDEYYVILFMACDTGHNRVITVVADGLAPHSHQDHNCDVIMGAMASQITSLTIVYSIVHSGTDQRKHQNSASLAFARWIHRRPLNSPHKWPVPRKMFPFDDVIMTIRLNVARASATSMLTLAGHEIQI